MEIFPKKRYTTYVDNFDQFKGKEAQELKVRILSQHTGEVMDVKALISQWEEDGYDELQLQKRDFSGTWSDEKWFIKILEIEEEKDEGITQFEGKRLGQRKGYMLKSILEEKERKKQETMTTELEEKHKRKQELIKEILRKKEED